MSEEEIKAEDKPEEVESTEQASEEQPKAEESTPLTPEEEAAKWKDTATRAVAELENYRKRVAKEKTESILFANQRLLEDLFPVIDNFNMGMLAASNDSDSMIFKGMEMVQNQLSSFLENQNVQTVIPKEGDDFDPNLHEAMSKEVSEELDEGKVIRVIRNGYQIGSRLIRPASITVSTKEEG